MSDVRTKISEKIGINTDNLPRKIAYNTIKSSKENGYERKLIEYDSCGETVIAYLLIPDVVNINPGILINHQHNGERHLGKSEVCGLAGDPLQAFGPMLAQRGFVVLAPDSICFEDRRIGAQGTTPLPDEDDLLQHYNEMCYRILMGQELLIKRVLTDAMNGITLLSGLSFVEGKNIGTLGHSYGGNTVLFLSAMDERISFSCASGSACTYRNKMDNGVGIEMSGVIPGFAEKYDIQDLVRCIAPRRLLIVSAEDDDYSKDADYIVEQALPAYSKDNNEHNLYHKRYPGGHALTKERSDFIVEWIAGGRSY